MVRVALAVLVVVLILVCSRWRVALGGAEWGWEGIGAPGPSQLALLAAMCLLSGAVVGLCSRRPRRRR